MIAATHLEERAAEAQAEQHRREGQRGAEQRVVEHGHLDQQRPGAIGIGDGELERGVGAERGAADDRALELEVVEQRRDLMAEGAIEYRRLSSGRSERPWPSRSSVITR